MPRDASTARTLYSAEVISASDQSSQSIDCSGFREATIYIQVTAKTDSPQIDFDVETSPDGTNWYKDSDVTQLNNPTVTFNAPAHKVANTIGRQIRLNPTLTTGTDMTITAVVILKD